MNLKLNYLFSKLIKKIQVPAVYQSNLNKRSKIASGSQIVNTTIGKYSYIGNSCTIIYTEIGNFCSIADNCIIGGAQHPVKWVSTSPVFHDGKNILGKNFSEHKFNPYSVTKIENDVWIGNNCLIKAGVTISNGAVIGMGSVVTKDVGPFEIWAGNPAKLIKYRFENEKIKKLIDIKWWTFDDQRIQSISKYMNESDDFIEEIEKEGIE